MAQNIEHLSYPTENSSDEAKIQYDEKNEAIIPEAGLVDQNDPEHHLHRGLKSRQITMIAIGGAIGTGLIIGTSVFDAVARLACARLTNTC